MKRQLAAILHADVAGYSRLTGQDEENTLQERERSIGRLSADIAEHNGQKVNEAGDAVLAVFESVTDAVNTAVEFQAVSARENEGLDLDKRFEFRMGIHLGEVIRDGGDAHGDGVNIAARIQGLAEPGGLCVSGPVYDQIVGKIDHGFDDLGHRKLKNIAQPVRVYQARIAGTTSAEGVNLGWPFITEEMRKPVATGGCLCRRIRFEVLEDPVLVGYCHCRFCQLATGAPLNAAVVYRKSAVRFSGEEPSLYTSSPISKRAFCGNCGTTLYTLQYGPDDAEFLPIRLGAMDHPEDFPPTMHYGIESRIPWLDLNDELPRMSTIDDPEMQRRWRAVGRPKPEDQLPTSICGQDQDPKDESS